MEALQVRLQSGKSPRENGVSSAPKEARTSTKSARKLGRKNAGGAEAFRKA